MLQDKNKILYVLDQIENAIARDPEQPHPNNFKLVCAVLRGMIAAEEPDAEVHMLSLLRRAFGRELNGMALAAMRVGLDPATTATRDAMVSVYRKVCVRLHDISKAKTQERRDTVNTTEPAFDYREVQVAQAKAIMSGLGIPEMLLPRKEPQLGPPWTVDTLNHFLIGIKVPAPAGAAQDFASVSVQNLPAGVDGQPSGFVFQLHWSTRCTTTGRREVVHGAKHFLSRHAATNEVAQAVLAAAIRASEHELRERFTYCGQPIYRPHQPLEPLREMTAATEPELRAIRQAEVC